MAVSARTTEKIFQFLWVCQNIFVPIRDSGFSNSVFFPLVRLHCAHEGSEIHNNNHQVVKPAGLYYNV